MTARTCLSTVLVTAATGMSLLIAASAGASEPVTHQAVGGESVKLATTIEADATAALAAAPSVRIVATTPGASLNLAFTKTTAVGSVTVKRQRIQLIRVGTTIFVNAPKSYWGTKTGPTLGGHWVRFAAASTVGRDYLPILSLAAEAKSFMTPTDPVTAPVTTAPVGATQAAVLTDPSDGSQLFVTDDDTSPLPLQITGTAKHPGTATFTYGVPVAAKAPTKFLIPKR